MTLGSRFPVVIAIAAFLVTAFIRSNDNPVLKGRKDNSAEGVAKVRHAEFMLEKSDQLYSDPYACYMFRGCSVQEWLGAKGVKVFTDFFFKGVFELLTMRTKWIDDEIRKRLVAQDEASAPFEQMLILGAGYDTRGFRLEFLPNKFKVLEIDQPEVQASKQKKLQIISEDEEKSEGKSVVGEKLRQGNVEFVPIDFNVEYDLGASLAKSSFDKNKKTIVLLEGVTQYIPKSSTETTLKKLREILPPGSILLVSYVPEQCIPTVVSGEDRVPSPTYRPEMCGPERLANIFLNYICPLIGEPWISGWTVSGFESFLKPLGYQVISDTTMDVLNKKYLKPLGRDLKEDEILSLERYVAAEVIFE